MNKYAKNVSLPNSYDTSNCPRCIGLYMDLIRKTFNRKYFSFVIFNTCFYWLADKNDIPFSLSKYMEIALHRLMTH